jgi:hypothetical protein
MERTQEAPSTAEADTVFAIPSLCGVSCDMPRNSLFLTLTAGCAPPNPTIALRQEEATQEPHAQLPIVCGI